MQTVRCNLKNGAPTQYTGFDFKSMFVFNGTVLACGAGGFFRVCCENDDEGVDIDAYFVFPTTDFEVQGKKRFRSMMAGVIADGAVSVTATGDDETTIGPYSITPVLTQFRQIRRVNIGRGMAFRYASVRVDNVDGADFTFDTLQMNFDARSRLDY